MTVEIHMNKLSELEKAAAIAVDREIGKRASYDSYLRELAVTAITEYEPAYVRVTDYSDQMATNAATWAMGGMLGVAIDPPGRLRGMRAVINWRETVMMPDEFADWLRVVLRNVKPVNAMAQIDRELLLGERGISAQEVEYGT